MNLTNLLIKRLIFLIVICTFKIDAKIQDHYKKIDNKTSGHSFGCINFVYLINLDHRPEKYQESINELKKYGITPFRFSAVNGWKIKHQALQEIGVKFTKNMRPGGMGSHFLWEDGKEFISHELIGKEGRTYFCHCIARGAIGCLMSHVSIMKDAYESGYELIWIMEDDIEVLRPPSLLLSYIKELDSLRGRKNWDLLYTDRDYRTRSGVYAPCYGTDYRPDVDTRNQERFAIRKKISTNIRRLGSRFATTSMIWTRSGLKKYLDYIEKHGMFLPIDMDIHLAPGMKAYSVVNDVVTNRIKSVSDNGCNWNKETVEY